LDPFADIVGVEPDAEVASKAGVSTETVRTFRVRRGIPALWRGEMSAPQKPAGVAASAVGAKSRKRAFRGRRSRLDPYVHLLGSLPDGEVAAMAGVTSENVRAFRRRRGIGADWKTKTGTTEAAPTSVAVRVPREAVPVLARVETQRWAYRVTARVGAENKDFVVFGDSLSDAAIQAEGRLAERIPRARVVEIVTLAEAL
jgi:hypothetical protein